MEEKSYHKGTWVCWILLRGIHILCTSTCASDKIKTCGSSAAYRFEYNSCKKASNVSLQFLVITVVISVLKNVYLFYPVEGQTNLNKHSLLKEQEPRHRVFWNNWSLGAIFIRFHAGKKQRRHTLKQGAPENPKARRHTARLFLKILWCGQLCSARNRRKIFSETSCALMVSGATIHHSMLRQLRLHSSSRYFC